MGEKPKLGRLESLLEDMPEKRRELAEDSLELNRIFSQIENRERRLKIIRLAQSMVDCEQEIGPQRSDLH